MQTTEQIDPELLARYEVHKLRRVKAGKPPFEFATWLECRRTGKKGGLAKAAAWTDLQTPETTKPKAK